VVGCREGLHHIGHSGVSNVVQTPGLTTVVVNTADATLILVALQPGIFGARR